MNIKVSFSLQKATYKWNCDTLDFSLFWRILLERDTFIGVYGREYAGIIRKDERVEIKSTS